MGSPEQQRDSDKEAFIKVAQQLLNSIDYDSAISDDLESLMLDKIKEGADMLFGSENLSMRVRPGQRLFDFVIDKASYRDGVKTLLHVRDMPSRRCAIFVALENITGRIIRGDFGGNTPEKEEEDLLPFVPSRHSPVKEALAQNTPKDLGSPTALVNVLRSMAARGYQWAAVFKQLDRALTWANAPLPMQWSEASDEDWEWLDDACTKLYIRSKHAEALVMSSSEHRERALWYVREIPRAEEEEGAVHVADHAERIMGDHYATGVIARVDPMPYAQERCWELMHLLNQQRAAADA